jgi:hypothetical protein
VQAGGRAEQRVRAAVATNLSIGVTRMSIGETHGFRSSARVPAGRTKNFRLYFYESGPSGPAGAAGPTTSAKATVVRRSFERRRKDPPYVRAGGGSGGLPRTRPTYVPEAGAAAP